MSATNPSQNWLRDFRAVLDRIIPADEYPSACEAGVDVFILRLWCTGSEASADMICDGISRVHGFGLLSLAAQERQLLSVADQDWFRRLCELAAEGYYADPGNGANPNAVSWRMIGYEAGLPEGLAGPPADPSEVKKGRLWA